MKHDEIGYLSVTREQLLENLELLQTFYNLCGKEKVIDFILRKKSAIKDVEDE